MTFRLRELKEFKGVLPYDSELFGVYQPLLGWKSQRAISRFRTGFWLDRARLYAKALNRFNTNVILTTDGKVMKVGLMAPGTYTPNMNSLLIR